MAQIRSYDCRGARCMSTQHQIFLLIIWLIPFLYWIARMFKEAKYFDFNIIWFLIPFINLFAMIVVLFYEDE